MFILFSLENYVRLEEKAQPWQFGFQLPATSVAEGILNFHHDLMQILVLILGVVLVMMVQVIVRFNKENSTAVNHLNHAPILEMVWTIIPALVLLLIAFPSFTLIYSADVLADAFMTIKVYGHQWYWSYEYLDSNYLINEWVTLIKSSAKSGTDLSTYESIMGSNFSSESIKNSLGKIDTLEQDILNWEHSVKDSKDSSFSQDLNTISKKYDSVFESENKFELENISGFFTGSSKQGNLAYDSYMIPSEDILKSSDRLLKVDNQLFLPALTNIRVVVSSGDVLHSWAVPALGVKIDACPGRLNQTSLYIKRPGTFFGQCSEICGANHGFMPICVESIDLLGGSQIDSTWREKEIGEGLQTLFRYYVRIYLNN